MRLSDILASKGNQVHSIRPNASLDDVVQMLVHHNCGSLMVCEDASCRRMLGIITERDILRACASGQPLALTEVADCMTLDMVTGTPDDTVEDTMGLMTQHRIRHLPVLENGELVGMISIGDLVKAQHDNLSLENHYLKSYLHG